MRLSITTPPSFRGYSTNIKREKTPKHSSFSRESLRSLGSISTFTVTIPSAAAEIRSISMRCWPKAQINSVISALGGWIRREGPKLTLAPIGRYGTPAVRQPDAIVPFKAALHRNSLPGAPGHLLVTHRVDELDDSRPGANLTIFSNPSRNLLHVTYPKTRVMPWGDTKIQQPSRYVSALLGVGQV
jgi:hypothetical protein